METINSNAILGTMTERNYSDLLQARWDAGCSISVGLDPELDRLPAVPGGSTEDRVIEFLRRVIAATADRAAAYKPNAAHFEALGANGFAVLRDVIDIVHELAPATPVILDAKRADIGNTNEKYAQATFDYLGADAITVHPYLGPEAMRPFIERKNNGIIVLARTSNPGAGRYQDLSVGGMPLYQHIAKDVAEEWNVYGNCGLVVGATYPQEMKAVRAVAPTLPILVPGIGAQGGDVAATVKHGLTANGDGLLLHAGRSLLYAFESGGTVEDATTTAMNDLSQEIAAALSGLQ
jgi:orotidine-5'-phosphate decarboxylase